MGHQIVVTAGCGFGNCGEGFVRLSAFAKRKNIRNAIDRFRQKL